MKTEAARLRSLVDTFLDQASALDWNQPYGPDKWLRIEVLGHLIDSAANNHQRFVRALIQPALVFPAYDAEENVAVQSYATADIGNLLELWSAYNFHIAHVVDQIPDAKLETPCTVGDDAPVTLEFLVKDYNDHLCQHLAQLTG